MPVVAESGFLFFLSHRGTGYTTGPTETIEHSIAPAGISVHVGISRVQASFGGPFGAAVGIMKFNDQDFGPEPSNWPAIIYGRAGRWTVGGQVTKGEMTAWEFFQVWV